MYNYLWDEPTHHQSKYDLVVYEYDQASSQKFACGIRSGSQAIATVRACGEVQSAEDAGMHATRAVGG